VLEGYLTMVNLHIPPDGLQGVEEGYEATASFCLIDWRLQQRNPSTVPMFKDLRGNSKMCDGTLISVDLFKVAREARAYDAQLNSTKTNQKDVAHPVAPTGVVFHETRCGSTLTANLLSSFSPSHTRVYSESPPPVTAFNHCDRFPCNPRLHTQLIQDVFYMMGRTLRAEQPQYLFFKIQSIGVMNIDKFTAAFPDTPWVFLYRDSVEVMQSHLKGMDKKWTFRTRSPVCARNFHSVYQPPTTQQLIESKKKSMEDMSGVEYCAAHLAGLSLSAIQEHERSGKGRFVNYNQLPSAVWESILPQDFGIDVDTEMKDNMQKVSGVYSKGRGKKANEEWEEDSARKISTAPQSVIDAAAFYLGDTFRKMEEISKAH